MALRHARLPSPIFWHVVAAVYAKCRRSVGYAGQVEENHTLHFHSFGEELSVWRPICVRAFPVATHQSE
jgi:hypothetical protein